MSTKTFALVFALLVSFSTFGQSALENLNYKLYLHSFSVMRHSEKMAHLADQKPFGIELDISSRKTGTEAWHHKHKYPSIGYSFLFIRMDPAKPLGDSYSLVVYYQKQFLATKKTYFTYKIGLGPGYIEKRFNSVTNPENNTISSRFNYTLSGRLEFVWQPTSAISFNAGAGLIHFSNGAMKVPNLGLNLPTLFFGVGFRPGKEEITRNPNPGEAQKSFESVAILAGGLKQINPIGGHSYFASTLSYYFSKTISHRSAITAGTDLFFDSSVKTRTEAFKGKKPGLHFLKSGLVLGHEYIINKTSVIAQIGYYLYNPLSSYKLYQRAQLRYLVNKTTFASVSLKTHLGQAEYVEWGVGKKF